MNRKAALGLLFAFGVLICAGLALAQQYPLLTGETLIGEPSDADANGVVFRKSDGNFTLRIAYTNFTQSALKDLAKNPNIKPHLEPLLDIEEDEGAPAKRSRPQINIKTPTRIDRPDPRASWGSLFSSPLSAALLFLVYLANLYAAYEIALFRRYHPGLVVGVAAVVPIIGPLLFLSLPAHLVLGELTPEDEVMTEAAPAETVPIEMPVAEAAPADTAHAGGKHLPPPAIYRRGETMFNRRFFETKLAGFLRVVPGEAEKDMLVHVKSSRGEHAGSRITRLLANELVLLVVKAGASTEVIIPFNEIQEVQVRHKDA